MGDNRHRLQLPRKREVLGDISFWSNPEILAWEAVEKVSHILRGRLSRQKIQHPLDIGFERRLLLVPVVRQTQSQEVVGLDIKLPQQVFLPWRKDFGVHGLDVGVRHENQHAKVVYISDQVGKLLNHRIVAEVSSKDDLRHFQVIPDRGSDLLRLLAWKRKLVE